MTQAWTCKECGVELTRDHDICCLCLAARMQKCPPDPRYEPRIGPLEFWSAPIVALLVAVALAFWLKH